MNPQSLLHTHDDENLYQQSITLAYTLLLWVASRCTCTEAAQSDPQRFVYDRRLTRRSVLARLFDRLRMVSPRHQRSQESAGTTAVTNKSEILRKPPTVVCLSKSLA